MIYTHPLNRRGPAIRSPLDALRDALPLDHSQPHES
jgi:hypothetical protein